MRIRRKRRGIRPGEIDNDHKIGDELKVDAWPTYFLFDAVGWWHGSKGLFSSSRDSYRNNTMYLDGHAKSLVNADYLKLWSTQIR